LCGELPDFSFNYFAGCFAHELSSLSLSNHFPFRRQHPFLVGMAVLSVILVLDGRDWNLPYEARPSALGAPDAIWTGGRVAPDSKNALSPASTDRHLQI
jgi:hypothetical protein